MRRPHVVGALKINIRKLKICGKSAQKRSLHSWQNWIFKYSLPQFSIDDGIQKCPFSLWVEFVYRKGGIMSLVLPGSNCPFNIPADIGEIADISVCTGWYPRLPTEIRVKWSVLVRMSLFNYQCLHGYPYDFGRMSVEKVPIFVRKQ